MSTAKKLKIGKPHTVSYQITGDHNFLIMTNNHEVVEIFSTLGHEMKYEKHRFHVTVEELPNTPLLVFRKHNVKKVSKKAIESFDSELDKLKSLEQAIGALHDEFDKQERKVRNIVKRSGLKIKPHLPKDSEIFSVKHEERCHVKYSVRTIIDQEVVEEMIESYPQLKKCFRTRKTVLFDRAKFNQLQDTISATDMRKIVRYEEVESLNFYELEDWECDNCGGKFTKKGICRHCGLQSKE